MAVRVAGLAARLALLALLSAASGARAQHDEASHFVYSGPLQVGGSTVAHANEAPLSRVRFGAGERIAVTVRGAGFTLEAEGAREGLSYHVHRWTLASAQGFQIFVPPDARLSVREGSRATAVVSPDVRFGEITLVGPRTLPRWLTDRLSRAEPTPSCHGARLYPTPRELGEPIVIEEGLPLHVPPRGRQARADTPRAAEGLEETWVMLEGRWVRGYARDVRCEPEEGASADLGIAGSSWASDPPPHVTLPAGLVLVSPSQPTRVVLRVTRPLDAIDWGPGWTAANDEGAILIALSCGLGDVVGQLFFTPTQLVPLGAPPR